MTINTIVRRKQGTPQKKGTIGAEKKFWHNYYSLTQEGCKGH